MSGGFTNRYVCKSVVPYNYAKVKEKLGNHYSSKQGKSYELRSLVSLEPEIVISENEKYLNGKLYYQSESNAIDYDITPEKKLVNSNSIRRNTYIVDFSLSSNNATVLFTSSKDYVVEGAKILSTILTENPDNIKNVNFDIKRIEADVLNNLLLGMWTFSFNKRHGNITSGVSYGENVNNDPIYGQIGSAPKNFIGIKKEIDIGTLKIAIFRKGTVRLLKNLDGEVNVPKIFSLIEDLKGYQLVEEQDIKGQSEEDRSDNDDFDESYPEE